jgi:uncharacterized protein with GYD domain
LFESLTLTSFIGLINKDMGMGGTLEAFYYAFGEDDVFAIVDLPDNVSTAAFALTANRSGAVRVKTTVLLTPEEVDQVTKKSIDYRPPGQ